jgi:hypothetical protein
MLDRRHVATREVMEDIDCPEFIFDQRTRDKNADIAVVRSAHMSLKQVIFDDSLHGLTAR